MEPRADQSEFRATHCMRTAPQVCCSIMTDRNRIVYSTATGRICPNCQLRFCPDHAGKNGMCGQCTESSFLGIVVLAGVGLILGALKLYGLFQRGG